MQDKYLTEQVIIDKSEKEKEIELLRSIIRTKEDLNSANKNFEFADKDLVDYYTYQIKANQSKLDYLIKTAKSKGIVLDMVNELKIRLFEENNKVI